MTEQQFGWRREYISAAPDAPSKDMPGDKSKGAPAVDQPPAQPQSTPAEVAPAPKS